DDQGKERRRRRRRGAARQGSACCQGCCRARQRCCRSGERRRKNRREAGRKGSGKGSRKETSREEEIAWFWVNLYLIAGLGNPGGDYARTRHNVGFMVLEGVAKRWGAGWTYEKKFNARLARAERSERTALLCEPQTYMNSSGEAVGAAAEFYRVPIGRLLIVLDDANLPF